MGSTPADINSDEIEADKIDEKRPALLMRLAGAPIIPMSTLSSVGFPVGVTWANWFAFFNAISWSVVLGAPLYLFAKRLGAGDELLGIIAALPPLLVVLHIPGNYLIPRLGYRRMVIFGWGARTAAAVLTVFSPCSRCRMSPMLICIPRRDHIFHLARCFPPGRFGGCAFSMLRICSSWGR